MGCNCKNDNNGIKVNENASNKSKQSLFIRSLIFLTKVIIFILTSVMATIIVIPFSIYMLYKTIFLNEGLNFNGILLSLGKKLKKDDEDDEDEFEDEDEFVLLNAEE